MKSIIDCIKEKAKQNIKRIVLPEGIDERVLKAARMTTDEKIAKIILVGNEDEIKNKAKEYKISLDGITLLNPETSDKYNLYVNTLYELRKDKGLTIKEAEELVKDPVYYGVLMVKTNDADGLVSGAIHSTADTLRPALKIIKGAPNVNTVSSFFLMEMKDSKYDKEYVFADCGLVENPTSEGLAQIAIESSKSYELLVNKKAKVALLSYSTYGSAKSEMVDKVTNALKIIKELDNKIIVDGELQLDAAIDENVAKMKAPKSIINGHANTLIFPNIEAGNIGYKLVERFGGANAYGPITQGLDKPVNDLSRGCKAEDIVGVIAITSLQANKNI